MNLVFIIDLRVKFSYVTTGDAERCLLSMLCPGISWKDVQRASGLGDMLGQSWRTRSCFRIHFIIVQCSILYNARHLRRKLKKYFDECFSQKINTKRIWFVDKQILTKLMSFESKRISYVWTFPNRRAYKTHSLFRCLIMLFLPMRLQTRFLFLDDLFHFSDEFLFPNDSSQISFSALLVAFEGKSDVMIYWRRAVFLLRRVLYQIKLRWKMNVGYRVINAARIKELKTLPFSPAGFEPATNSWANNSWSILVGGSEASDSAKDPMRRERESHCSEKPPTQMKSGSHGKEKSSHDRS